MLAVIRVRGLKDVRHDITAALIDMRLDRKNHCVLVPENEALKGMLIKTKDYVAYGKISPETLSLLILKRGRTPGDGRVTTETLQKGTHKNAKDLAAAVIAGKATLLEAGIKPVFRLNSPKGGFPRAGIKKSVTKKGPLGFHPEGLDALIKDMM